MEALIATLLGSAVLVWYVLIYVPRSRGVVYRGDDSRLRGTYRRLSAKTSARQLYTPHTTDHLTSPWSREVWQNQDKPEVCIYDHHIDGMQHVWSLGAWDPENGGLPAGVASNPYYGRCYATRRVTAKKRFSPPLLMQDALQRAFVVSINGATTGRFFVA